MSTRGTIEVEAVVVAAGGAGAVRARLVNGHQFVACVWQGARRAGPAAMVGDRIRVRFSPCDLSKGWIILESEVKQ